MEVYITRLPDWTRTISVQESAETAEALMTYLTGLSIKATPLPDAKPYTVSPYQPGGVLQFMVQRRENRQKAAEHVMHCLEQMSMAGFGPYSLRQIMEYRMHWQNTKLVPPNTSVLVEGSEYNLDVFRNSDHNTLPATFYFLTVDNWAELPDA